MKKYSFLVLAVVILGIIIYITFVIALIKITLGLILLAVAVIFLWLLWQKIKEKAKEKF
ncbi:hypothetical protein SAMN04488553_1983 [Gramella sp. MAR_2010_147]|nr:hypothetical protein SAMN04488553_1983 [Gramella sp. MAR_2010_147]